MDQAPDQDTPRYTRVLVKAEYVAQPLWDRTPGRPNAEIEYEELGVSPELAEKLDDWNASYESRAFVGRDDAFNRRFTAAGAALAAELQQELGPRIEVLYVDGFTGPPAAPPPIAGRGLPGEYRWSAERDVP